MMNAVFRQEAISYDVEYRSPPQVQASKIPEQLADSSSPPLRWEYLQRLFWSVAKLLWSEHDGFHGMRHEVISPLSANHSRRSSTREGQSARPGC